MNNKECYDSKLPIIQAIPEEQIKSPHDIPISVYLQEASNLCKWCRQDRDPLIAKGLDWELVTDLPIRLGALAEAESSWSVNRMSKGDAAKKWTETSSEAYKLRDKLLHEFRFAFRDKPAFVENLNRIPKNESHAGMIQDLNNLRVIGENNRELLTAVNFDHTLLEQVEQLSQQLSTLYAQSIREANGYDNARIIRDQAYTHLKEAVDRIYRFGQHLFLNDPHRKRGYRSNYLWEIRKKKKAKTAPPTLPTG